jgi:GST-like protein
MLPDGPAIAAHALSQRASLSIEDTPGMIKFFFNPGPNPMKVALLLEELGLPYETVPVDMRKGEQHLPGYLAINPNAKVPALVDGDATIFDSNAILLYLAEKTGRFLPPASPSSRAQLLSWLMFIATGVGPYSGQSVYFRNFTPEPNPAALNRYDFEAERHWRILDQRLADRPYVLGEDYTIADMALWGWARMIPGIFGGEDAWSRFPHVRRLLDQISARPAGVAAEALKTRFTFKKEMDEDARRQMFPQLARLHGGSPAGPA